LTIGRTNERGVNLLTADGTLAVAGGTEVADVGQVVLQVRPFRQLDLVMELNFAQILHLTPAVLAERILDPHRDQIPGAKLVPLAVITASIR